jgi:hypothetical protein
MNTIPPTPGISMHPPRYSHMHTPAHNVADEGVGALALPCILAHPSSLRTASRCPGILHFSPPRSASSPAGDRSPDSDGHHPTPSSSALPRNLTFPPQSPLVACLEILFAPCPRLLTPVSRIPLPPPAGDGPRNSDWHSSRVQAGQGPEAHQERPGGGHPVRWPQRAMQPTRRPALPGPPQPHSQSLSRPPASPMFPSFPPRRCPSRASPAIALPHTHELWH